MKAHADAYFETRFRDTEQRRRLWPVLAGYLQQYVPDDAAVLDVGAGYCYFINNVRAREKHALDVSEIVTRFAAPDVVPHVSPASDMSSLEDEHFDVAFASNVLEHLERDELYATLAELRRVLRRGGRVILIQPNFRVCYRTYFDDYTHVQVFTDRSLADLLRVSGFDPETVIPRFLPFSADSRLPASPRLLSLYLRLPYRPLARQMLVVATKRGA